jgi:hypothetical protein
MSARAHPRSDFCADLLGCCESERCWANLWKLTLKGRRQKAPAAPIPLMQIVQRETNPLKAFRLLKLLKILIEAARFVLRTQGIALIFYELFFISLRSDFLRDLEFEFPGTDLFHAANLKQRYYIDFLNIV